MPKRTRVAVVGLGAMGRTHARVYGELKEAELCAVCDVAGERAQRTADDLGVRAYRSLDDLLAGERPEAVSVAVPTPLHAEVATRCLEAGAHVLVEKPIAATPEEGERLADAARRCGRLLGVGYVERFNPAFLALRSLVRAGTLGRVISLSVKRVGGLPSAPSETNVVSDLATHDIDLLMQLLGGAPTQVGGYVHRVTQAGVVDAAEFVLRFGEVTAMLQVNWITPVKVRTIELTGSDGYCEANLILQRVQIFRTHYPHPDEQPPSFEDLVSRYGEPDRTEVGITRKEPLREELRAFLHAAATGDPRGLVAAQDALAVLRVAQAALHEAERASSPPPAK